MEKVTGRAEETPTKRSRDEKQGCILVVFESPVVLCGLVM